MTWTAVPLKESQVTAEYLYDLSKKHRLLPDDLPGALEQFRRIAEDCFAIKITDSETKEVVGDIIISEVVDGQSASLDLIPNPKFFSPGEDFHDNIFNAVNPILVKLMESRGLRRIDALVPQTRCRTKKALKACGFRVEGVRRNAIKFQGKPPEGQTIMGILPGKE